MANPNKTTTILYWIFTGLFAALMLFSAIPNIMVNAESVKFMCDTLHYPHYMIAFLGVAKLLGVIAILVPGFPRIKEWAYAGLMFDLLGATYSVISVSKDMSWLPMLLFVALGFASYFYYHKKYRPTV